GLSLLGRIPLPVGSQDSCLSRRSQPTSVQENYALRFKDETYRLIDLKLFVFYINLFYYEINYYVQPYDKNLLTYSFKDLSFLLLDLLLAIQLTYNLYNIFFLI